jgi:inhibitor of cysteine peptidase
VKERFGRLAAGEGVLLVIVAAIVVAAVSGCAAQAALALEADDNGEEITLQKGQILTIKLEANPTTGYSWEIVPSDNAILSQTGDPEFEADSELLGARATQTLRFEAVESGRMELRLVYHRPWETGVQPFQTFSVLVTVS